MTARLFAYVVIALIALLLTAGCGEADAPEQPTAEPQRAAEAAAPASGISEMARAGESVFNANCSICHGVGAVGTKQGPPLTDGVYHPGHHGDPSFRNASAATRSTRRPPSSSRSPAECGNTTGDSATCPPSPEYLLTR